MCCQPNEFVWADSETLHLITGTTVEPDRRINKPPRVEDP